MSSKLSSVGGLLSAVFLFSACRGSGPKIEIAEDAEPWQVGTSCTRGRGSSSRTPS